MPKRIYIVRHAKAETDGAEDFKRKLAPKGKKQGKKLCEYMKKNGISPEAVACSPAKRAQQTLKLLSPAMPKANAVLEASIYEGTPRVLLTLLQRLDNNVGSIMLIGHNPAIMTLCAALANTKTSDIKALKKMLAKFPTGAMACFSADIRSWKDLTADKASLESFVQPGKL